MIELPNFKLKLKNLMVIKIILLNKDKMIEKPLKTQIREQKTSK